MPSDQRQKMGDSSGNREITQATRHYSEPGPIATFPEGGVVPSVGEGGVADDEVVEDFNLQKLAGPDEVAGDFDVGFRGGRVARWVIMLCAAPVYVQLPVVGSNAEAGCRGTGVLCLTADHASDPDRRGLFAD